MIKRCGSGQGWHERRQSIELWAEHSAQGVAIDELDVALAGGGFAGGLGELAAGDDDGAGGVLVDLDAE